MSSNLVLKVASLTSTKAFAKTDAEMAVIIKLFLADTVGAPPEGMTVAQTNQWYLDQALEEIFNLVRNKARRNKEAELRKTSLIEQQAESETNF